MSFRSDPGASSREPIFASMAEHMPGALLQYVLGPGGEHRIGWMSPGCQEIWEVAAQAAVQDADLLWSLVDAQDLLAMRASVLESARSLQDWTQDWRITTPSGRHKWLHGVGRPQRQPDGWVVWNTVVVDVTDSKRSGDAMRDSEARFRQLLEYVPNVSVQGYGLDLTTRYWNQASERLYGYSAAEAIGRNLLDLIIPPEMHAGVVGAVTEMIESGLPIPAADLSLRRKDGTLVEVHSSHVYLNIPGREPEFYCIDFDLTERRDSESIRALLQSQLRESQKMEALGTLAGGVAHDFNNIVAAIIGNVELALDDVSANSPARASLMEIRKASRRARDLVQQILAFSRRQVLERQVIELAPVVEESVRLLRATLPAGVELNVQIGAGVPRVLADATQIEQVLLNLCTNAWQAVRGVAQGRVAIRLEAHVEGPAAAGAAPTAWARLTVSDNGQGMSDETRARMFEPFFTTKPPGKGTGLGLAVVHGILRDHDAVMEVQSAPGEGSIFSVSFPAVLGAASATVSHMAQQVHPQRAASPQGAHILYVDDDEMIAFLMERLLQREGYRVTVFTHAAQALAALREQAEPFDLVITDYNMPGMSGLDFARAVKALWPDSPVAITSGYISEELRAQAPAAGVSELIYKPNTVEELFAAVDRLVRSVLGPQQRG
ncbi:MAG: response regulator [Hydrogenophaga sp.]|nr:response regulator [Hydrogenophaga sp.]